MRQALAGVLAGLFVSHSFAQEEAVVVTARRSEQLLREAIPHTTVITERQIRESLAVDLPTVLRMEAGVEIVQNGGIGRTTGTFMRGMATGQSLVLVDGVRVADLNNGVASLDQFMLDEIERVEIVRGNVSSIYGSGAMGGVVQIFTKRGRGEPRLSLDAGAGGEGDRRVRVGYGGEHGDTRFNVTASAFRTDGFSALREGASPTADPDRDGYRNKSLALSASQRLTADHEAGFSYYTSVGKQEFDDAFALSINDKQTADVQIGTLAAYLNSRFTPAWLSKLSVAQSSNSNHGFVNGTTDFQTKTRNRQFTWQNDLAASQDQRFQVGLEHMEQEIEGTIAYSRTSRDVDALFAGYNGRFGRHSAQLNARQEHYSDFGEARTYYLGYGFDLTERWRILASNGTGFRAPTFNELFFPPIDLGGGFVLGCNDPNLKPERSRSYETGLQYATASTLLKMMAFHTRVDDLIAPGCPPQNVDYATIDGVGASFAGQWRGTALKAALTLQDPVAHAASGDSPLLRRAKRFGSLSAARAFGSWRAGAELLASGPRPDVSVTSFTGERVGLPGYGVVNATVRYLFSKDTSLALRIDNVLDKDYSLTDGFNTQGRKATVLLSCMF